MADDLHGVAGLDGIDPALAKAIAAINCEVTSALASIARDGVTQPDGSVVPGLVVVDQFLRGFVAFRIDVGGLRFIDGPNMPPDKAPLIGGYL
jgi:hypothetical protein